MRVNTKQYRHAVTKTFNHVQINGGENWMTVFETSQPDATSLTVTGLRPYTGYKLILIAENIAGQSDPSEPTRNFQTIQAAPSGPPPEVTVRAVNETAIRVRWKVCIICSQIFNLTKLYCVSF